MMDPFGKFVANRRRLSAQAFPTSPANGQAMRDAAVAAAYGPSAPSAPYVAPVYGNQNIPLPVVDGDKAARDAAVAAAYAPDNGARLAGQMDQAQNAGMQRLARPAGMDPAAYNAAIAKMTRDYLSAPVPVTQQPSAANSGTAASAQAAPAYGSGPTSSVAPIPGAADPNSVPIQPAVPDSWGGNAASFALSPATGFGGVLSGTQGGPGAFNAAAGDPNGPMFSETVDQAVAAGGGGAGGIVGTTGSLIGGALTAIGEGPQKALSALPYIDKPRQFSATQLGEAMHDIANGDMNSPRALALEVVIGQGGAAIDKIVADKDRINALYTQGADMGGTSVVDPATGKVTQVSGERIDGGRAVYEKYYMGASDTWPWYVKIPLRAVNDIFIDPLTVVLPGASKAGDALIEAGGAIRAGTSAARVADVAGGTAARDAATTAAKDAAGTVVTDAGAGLADNAAATAATDVAPTVVSPKIGPLSGAEPAVSDAAFTTATDAARRASASTWAAMAPADQAAAAAAARDVLQKTGGVLLQITGHALKTPQEVLDAVARIAVNGPIAIFKRLIGPLDEASQTTIRKQATDAANRAGRDVANADTYNTWNAMASGADTPREVTPSELTQAQRDYRREVARGYETGGTGSTNGPSATEPPKRWTPDEVQAETKLPIQDAMVEANRRNATGARAEWDAARVGGQPTEPAAAAATDATPASTAPVTVDTPPLNADGAPTVGDVAPSGETNGAVTVGGDAMPVAVGGDAMPAPEPPVSVGQTPLADHLTPEAVDGIANEPGWYREWTQADRHAAIQSGKITELTPVKNGERVVDTVYQNFGRSGDPAKQATWTAFQDQFAPKAKAFTEQQRVIDETRYPTFTEKRAREAVGEAEHVVNDVVPTYRETVGGMPDVAVTAERQPVVGGKKPSYTQESDEFLIQRAVYSQDADASNGALKMLTERWQAIPARDELIGRLQRARADLTAVTEAERGAPVAYVAKKQTVYAVYADGTEAKTQGFQSAGQAHQFAAEQHASLVKPRSFERPAGERAPSETGRVSAPTDGFTSIDKITVDPSQFQMRGTPYVEDHVQTIVDTFNENNLDPIKVRSNPDGTFTVLSGHNRREAIRRLVDQGRLPNDFRVPIKVVSGDEARLLDVALTSNNLTRDLLPSELGGNLQRQLDNGKAWPDLLKTNNIKPGPARRGLDINMLPNRVKELVDQGIVKEPVGGVLGEYVRTEKMTPEEIDAFWHTHGVTRVTKDGRPNPYTAETLRFDLDSLVAAKAEAARQAQLAAAGADANGMAGLFGDMRMDFGSHKADELLQRSQQLFADLKAAKADEAAFTRVVNNPNLSEAERAPVVRERMALHQRINQNEFDLGRPLTRFGGTAPRPARDTLGIVSAPPSSGGLFFANLSDPTRITRGLDRVNQRAGATLDSIAAKRAPSAADGSIPLAAHGDHTVLGDMLNEGNIFPETYELMNRTTADGTSYFDVFDSMMADARFDGEEAARRFGNWAATIEGKTVDRNALSRFVRATTDIPRGILQYNVATGWRGVAGDVFGDFFKTFFEGHAAPSVDRLNPIGYIKKVAGQPDALDEFLTKTELIMPNLEPAVDRTGSKFGGDTPLVKGLMKLTRGRGKRVAQILAEPLDSRITRTVRQAGDTINRRVIFLDTAQKEVPHRVDRWLALSRERMTAAGLDDGAFDHLDDLFTTTQAREAALAGGADEKLANRIARDWKAELNGLGNTAKTEVNRVLFSFETTRLDDALQNFFFFHYYMSRSYPQYASMAIRNPETLAIWYRVWKHTEREAETQGLPPSFVGRIRYMGSMGGFLSSFNPLYTLLPLNPADWGGAPTGQDPTLYDRVTKVLFPNPALAMAASIFGLTDRPVDPLMSYGVRRAFGTYYNWMRAHGWIGDKSQGNAGYEQWLTNAQNGMHSLVAWAGLPNGGKWITDDSNAYSKEVMGYVARDVVVRDTGVPFEQWTDKEWGAWNAANTAIKMQIPGDATAEEAFRIYQDAMAANTGAAGLIPGGSKLTYGPRDTSRAAVSSSYAAARGAAQGGPGPTAAQQSERDFKAEAQATAGAAPLLEADRKYGNLGDSWSRALSNGWADIAFGDAASLHGWNSAANMPTNYLQIGGVWYRIDDLANPTSKIDRTALADQWVAERVNPATQAAGTVDLGQLRDQQQTFKTADATYGQYADWKRQIGKYPGGRDAWIADARRGNPNYDAFLTRQKDPAMAAKIATTVDAYLAWKGQAESIYAAPTQPVNDPSAAPYNPSAAAGGAFGGQPESLSRPDSLRKSIADYDAKMTAVQQYMPTDASGKTVDFDQMPPTVKTAYLDQLRKQGITLPSLPAKVATFYEWRSLQKPGADTSEEAFFQWLDATQGTSGYTDGLTPAA